MIYIGYFVKQLTIMKKKMVHLHNYMDSLNALRQIKGFCEPTRKKEMLYTSPAYI